MLSSGIMQRAFVEAIVLGLACGPLGVWILLLRRSYAAESLSHAMLPGLVIAALAGVPLLLGAAAGVLVAAGGIALVARDARAGGDIGVAVVVSGLFGLGGILALSPETPPRLGELLFGDLLGHHQRRPARGRRALGRRAARARGRLPRAGGDRVRARQRAGARRPARARRPRAARAAGGDDGRRRPGARQPAARRADPRARRGRAQPRRSGCPRRSRWPPRWRCSPGSRAWSSPTSSRSRRGRASRCAPSHFRVLALLKPKLGMP